MAVEIINGRRVGVSRKGSGAPMLMLHCALAHRGALGPLMAAMPKRAFTAFDLPGHGETEFDTAVDIQAQAVETAISLLEETGPSDVFGHSFGATVALKLALERPDLVRALSLFEPVYFSVLATANPKAYAIETKASAAFGTACLVQDWPAAARAFLARWSVDRFDTLPAPQQAYILRTIPLIMASKSSIISPQSGVDLLEKLKKLEVPIQLITGGTSPVVINEIAEALAAHAASISKKIIKTAGHMGPITHVNEVAALVSSHTA